jgi:hypothetical protein
LFKASSLPVVSLLDSVYDVDDREVSLPFCDKRSSNIDRTVAWGFSDAIAVVKAWLSGPWKFANVSKYS